MQKIPQQKEDLNELFEEQLAFLETSADNYDAGKEAEAKRMAVHIRTLFHDTLNKDGTPKSQSLVGLLGLKGGSFYDSSFPEAKNSIGPYSGLTLLSVGPTGGKYVAPLDDFPPDHTWNQVPFDRYWTTDIFADSKGHRFSRKKLILAIANKDGGAHVDPELDQDYVDLTKNNSLGWIYGNEFGSAPFSNPASAAVRQVTHEILKTFRDNYPEKKELNKPGSVVLGGIQLVKGLSAGYLVNTTPNKAKYPEVGRNQKCPCESGQKYKRCHGAL